MIITICMSMLLSDQLPALTRELEAAGHIVFTPVDTEGFDYVGASTVERAEQKRSYDLIRKHWQKIQRSDAILVVNEDLPGRPAHIGGNTFLEMGFAHVLELPIYMMQPVPDTTYASEMLAMDPIILHGDLTRIGPRIEPALAPVGD